MNRSACVDRLNRRCFGEPVMQPAARILVVEDEFLVAMQIEAILTRAGWRVIGSAGTLSSAVSLARKSACDAALLDVNLRGARADEVAAIVCVRVWPWKSASRISAKRRVDCKAIQRSHTCGSGKKPYTEQGQACFSLNNSATRLNQHGYAARIPLRPERLISRSVGVLRDE